MTTQVCAGDTLSPKNQIGHIRGAPPEKGSFMYWPCWEKTYLWDLRPGSAKTSLLSYIDYTNKNIKNLNEQVKLYSCISIVQIRLSQWGGLSTSFRFSSSLCHLLITFANSLDPDQAWQNVRPDLYPNYLTIWWYSERIFWKSWFWKKSAYNKKNAKLPRRQRDKPVSCDMADIYEWGGLEDQDLRPIWSFDAYLKED